MKVGRADEIAYRVCGGEAGVFGSVGPNCSGVLMVAGGVTVADALTFGKITSGVFGMLPPNCVTC